MRICLISFSNNADYQSIIYSMFNAIGNTAEVYTFGIKNPKCIFAPYTNRNYYFDCPLRPGIEKNTFKMSVLFKMASVIRKEKIDFLFFESQHIWNAVLMLLCPNVKKAEVIHDVIPHDGNKAMTLCNFVTSHLANYVVLPNIKYKGELSYRYNIPLSKIYHFELWKDFPEEKKSKHSGIFLTFGRIRKYKGLNNLLHVVKSLPEIRFKIVGQPDDESMPIIEKLKCYSNVAVIDREVSDREMEIEFDSADWVVLPYSDATQSGVIIDAYRHSRPVIAFDVGAISEQVCNKKSGLLIEENNIEKLVSTIREAALISMAEHEQYCHEAYVFGNEKYSAERHAVDFIKLVDSMR